MAHASPLFLGLDVGTQSLRAAVIDAAGNCRSFATSPIHTTYPQPGWAEQDASQWWQAAREAVPALARILEKEKLDFFVVPQVLHALSRMGKPGVPPMAKLLLVEDNEMNRDMLSRRLERKGYQVIMAVDGGQGVAMAQSEHPDLILVVGDVNSTMACSIDEGMSDVFFRDWNSYT